MKTSHLLPALLCAALTLTFTASAQEELRAEAEKLVEKAKQAKSEGRGEEADQLMGQVKMIQGKLRQQLSETGGGDKAAKQRPDMERVRHEIEELHRAGKHDDAARLEQKFAGKKGAPAEGDERIHHVMTAIEHLRAAGLNEPAEDLTRLAQKMREELQHGQSAGKPGPDRGENQLREVHEAMQQLRGQMEKMQRQLEELRAQGGKPHGDKEGR